jgi:outer membrane protein assembly factor BamC
MLVRIFTLLLSFGLVSCSVLEEDVIDYKTSSTGNKLEIPPDLTQLSKDQRYQIKPNGVSASSANTVATNNSGTVTTAALTLGDVRVERSGNQRWLVVKRAPEALWPEIRDFWLDNGFLLNLDDQSIGIMETDWAENRAKLPQDFIRNSIGKVFDQLYSTGERDKFRTRLERLPNGDTEIYVSHKGLVEQLTGKRSPGEVSSTIWETRDRDPELEAEFLRRMLVKLGVSKEQSKKVVATTDANTQKVSMTNVNGSISLSIPEGFDIAWRRVGLALDRTGFTVEDRNRSTGSYFVRYSPIKSTDGNEPGFFRKILNLGSSEKETTPVAKYSVVVESTANTSTVKVRGPKNEVIASADEQKILNILAQDLK